METNFDKKNNPNERADNLSSSSYNSRLLCILVKSMKLITALIDELLLGAAHRRDLYSVEPHCFSRTFARKVIISFAWYRSS